MKPSPSLVSGLMLLSLLALLSGCASTATRLPPPEQLLQDCPAPTAPPVATNGDLIRLLPEWRRALDNCNADKAALRAWAQGD